MDATEVDGSFGEGGGQILRTAVAFSLIQQKPVRVVKVRAGREVPGLRQQHVSTLLAMKAISGAELRGVELGSTEVLFVPGAATAASASVDMKTAASITLLLQAVIPAIALSRSSAVLRITGGTDVPWSPTLDYLSQVVRPAYRALGINFDVKAGRRGYYPRGGGKVTAEVGPSSRISHVDLTRGEGKPEADLVSRCGSLPRHVADRQLESMAESLSSAGVTVSSRIASEEQSDSPGSSALASVTRGGRILGADAIGARGVRAEDVGRRVADRLLSDLTSGAVVDANLADMMAPLLSMADGESRLRVPRITPHLETSLYVARLFTGCSYSWKMERATHVVSVRPVSRHNA